MDGITYVMDMSLSRLQEFVKVREAWYAVVHRVTDSATDRTILSEPLTPRLRPPPTGLLAMDRFCLPCVVSCSVISAL